MFASGRCRQSSSRLRAVFPCWMSRWLLGAGTQRRCWSQHSYWVLEWALIWIGLAIGKIINWINKIGIIWVTYPEYLAKEYLIKLIYILILLLLATRCIWAWAWGLTCCVTKSFCLWCQPLSAWHEEEVIILGPFLLLLAFLISNLTLILSLDQELRFFILEVINDLWDVAVISLACKLENLIDVLSITLVSSCVLVLILYIDLNLHLLSVSIRCIFDSDWFTFGVIYVFLVDKLFKEGLWYRIIGHSVSSHLERIEIIRYSQDISLHALIVDQVDIDWIVQLDVLRLKTLAINLTMTGLWLNVCVLLPDHSEAGILSRESNNWFLAVKRSIKAVGISDCVPVVLYGDVTLGSE